MTDPKKTTTDDERRVADFLAALDDAFIPDEVVARLDTTLERLVAARSQETNVVALRPRRRWASALVAAATVSVVGVGVGAIWQQSERGTTASDAAVDTARNGQEFEALDSASPLASGPLASPRTDSGDAPGSSGYVTELGSSVPAFTGAGFPGEVRAWLQGGVAESADRDRLQCAAPDSDSSTASGSVYAATYEGADAVVVVGPVRNGEQRVEIFRCGGDDTALASTVVPAS
jgi:hypothetical protein